MSNEYEAENRLRKAYRLVPVLEEVLDRNPEMTVDDLIERATAETRLIAAKAAGTRVPSEETWKWACELVRERRSRT